MGNVYIIWFGSIFVISIILAVDILKLKWISYIISIDFFTGILYTIFLPLYPINSLIFTYFYLLIAPKSIICKTIPALFVVPIQRTIAIAKRSNNTKRNSQLVVALHNNIILKINK